MSRRSEPVQSLSLQQISDRLLIQDLIVEEAAAIDERAWDRWQAFYTDDALIDWSGNRGARGNPAEVRAWAESVLSTANFPYPQYQHYCTNFRIRVDGDRASARHLQLIPISVPAADAGRQMAFSGIWFDDEFVRSAVGWRICARRETLAWSHNFPDRFEVPTP